MDKTQDESIYKVESFMKFVDELRGAGYEKDAVEVASALLFGHRNGVEKAQNKLIVKRIREKINGQKTRKKV